LNCDIVNSTGLATAVDPEILQALLTRFHDICKRKVEEHRGEFAHHTGDGFVAYFGSKKTQGRNAQEAISCGLAVVRALSESPPTGERKIEVRVGIATGLVVLSTIGDSGPSASTLAIGASVHLSSRIQTSAEPGHICVDGVTHELAKTNFTFVDGGLHQYKGFSEPIQTWVVEAELPMVLRFEERRERILPLVGRSRERKCLSEGLDLARSGTGQAVLVSGEAGIGKSRLVYDFLQGRCQAIENTTYQCLQDHENEPLHPWVIKMRHLAGISLGERVDERLRKADDFCREHLVEFGSVSQSMRSLIARDAQETDPQFDWNATYKLDALQAAIVRYVFPDDSMVRVVVLEDIHWMDPSSRAIVKQLLPHVTRTPTLLLMTSRRGDDLEDAATPVTRLPLDRLPTAHAIRLATHVIGKQTVSSHALASAVERSDGIPLYIEEMARSLTQASKEGNGAAEPARQVGAGQASGIPATLQGTLMARLDALGDASTTAQLASVIGPAFEFEVLHRLSARPRDALLADVSALVDAGVLRSAGGGPASHYEFRHALLRQAAYDSLLHADATRIHAELADIYEAHYPDFRSTSPAILAQHLASAKRWIDAAGLWLQAGLVARDVGSTLEAMARFDSCLKCLESADTTTESKAIAFRCQLSRGMVIYHHFGPSDPRVQDALAAAADVANGLGDRDALSDALTSLSLVRYNSADFRAASAVAARLVGLGSQFGSRRALATGRMVQGLCHFATGRFREAQMELEEAVNLLSEGAEGTEAIQGRALVYLGVTLHILGRTAEARSFVNVAIELARHRRALDLAVTLGNSLYVFSLQSNTQQIRRISQELEGLAREKGFLMWYHHARFFLGWADAVEGDHAGLRQMEASMDRFRSAQEVVEQSFFYGLLAERYLDAGEIATALKNAEAGLQLVQLYGERFYEIPLLGIKSRCLAASAQSEFEKEVSDLESSIEALNLEFGETVWSRPNLNEGLAGR
jgi:class 3 adenylate cyclase/tetratricopeptide (TPR) repeat protein